MAIEDSFERCTLVAQRNSIIVHLQNAFRCITRNVIALLGTIFLFNLFHNSFSSFILASTTITQIDQLHYLQQLEALDAQKASLISYLLTNQFDQSD